MMAIWRGNINWAEDYTLQTLNKSVPHAVYDALQGVDRVSRFRAPRNSYTLVIL